MHVDIIDTYIFSFLIAAKVLPMVSLDSQIVSYVL